MKRKQKERIEKKRNKTNRNEKKISKNDEEGIRKKNILKSTKNNEKEQTVGTRNERLSIYFYY